MGEATGFLKWARETPTRRPVPVRLLDWREVYEPFPAEKVLSARDQETSVDRAVWHKGLSDEVLLKKLIEDHHKWTGSLRARDILDRWAELRARFVKVFPHEYKRALGELHAAREAGDTIAKARSGDKKSKAVPAK